MAEHSPLATVEDRYGPLVIVRYPWATMQHGDCFDAFLCSPGAAGNLGRSFNLWQRKRAANFQFYYVKRELPNGMTRVTLLDKDVI